MARPLARFVDVRSGEGRALLLAALYFLLVLAANGVLRSLRDGLPDVSDMPWNYTGTFLTTLAAVPAFLWVVARFPRRRIVPIAYVGIAASLLLFAALHPAADDGPALRIYAAAFWAWFSTINLLFVALFWSFMADLFGPERGKRLFAAIAMGGTLGAFLGAMFTANFAARLGAPVLLMIAAGLLLLCCAPVAALLSATAAWPARTAGDDRRAPIGGGLLDGAKHIARRPYLQAVAGQVLCLTAMATLSYMFKAHVVRADSVGPLERVSGFARIDAVACALEFVLQLVLTGPLLARGGLVWGLRSLPAVFGASCLLLVAVPTQGMLGLVEGVRRATQYAIYRPARELLFTVVPPVETYGAKGFIDTLVYRGGDVSTVWVAHALFAAGSGVTGLALAGLPIAAAWFALAGWLARAHRGLADAAATAAATASPPSPNSPQGQPA